MTNNEYLNSFLDTTIHRLELVRTNGVKKEINFTIKCSDLEDYNHVDIRHAPKFKEIFDNIRLANGPSLYWFEIACGTGCDVIIDKLKSYKASPNAKATPALKKTIDPTSRILYVGKVKGSFWGRLIQHMGFYKVNATQGLQLFYWAKDLCIDLKITVLEFEPEMADIMPIIEYAFAQRLKPIIGRHK